MNPAILNKRVDVQELTETQNTYGEPIRTWATTCKRWASIEPLGGREADRAKQTYSTATHKIVMRHMDGLTTQNRISYDGRSFAIGAIANTREANKELVLTCSEQV